jgi:hypothetical protein
MARALPQNVAAAYDAFPAPAKAALLHVRALIFETAAQQDVGQIEETLKWGEPAYLTAPRIGSTVRLGWKKKQPDHGAIFLNCQTTLIGDLRAAFGGELTFQGNRAILLPLANMPPDAVVGMCISAALTYHRAKREKSAA